ncbi:hypothetical protein NEHOM01_1883 [Nematocida homosporus]|uniref:uncharacterized protein n=1 Tax=Nematocida homosporus TaxID=1912981 RepID=UPI00221E90C5|nr:uncharacterized protein NEHOM01_1883 [Nematocida homosporus]KAI5187038.1 hypothetical protein NEHOM01_1883 [Nematocida homosporus]
MVVRPNETLYSLADKLADIDEKTRESSNHILSARYLLIDEKIPTVFDYWVKEAKNYSLFETIKNITPANASILQPILLNSMCITESAVIEILDGLVVHDGRLVPVSSVVDSNSSLADDSLTRRDSVSSRPGLSDVETDPLLNPGPARAPSNHELLTADRTSSPADPALVQSCADQALSNRSPSNLSLTNISPTTPPTDQHAEIINLANISPSTHSSQDNDNPIPTNVARQHIYVKLSAYLWSELTCRAGMYIYAYNQKKNFPINPAKTLEQIWRALKISVHVPTQLSVLHKWVSLGMLTSSAYHDVTPLTLEEVYAKIGKRNIPELVDELGSKISLALSKDILPSKSSLALLKGMHEHAAEIVASELFGIEQEEYIRAEKAFRELANLAHNTNTNPTLAKSIEATEAVEGPTEAQLENEAIIQQFLVMYQKALEDADTGAFAAKSGKGRQHLHREQTTAQMMLIGLGVQPDTTTLDQSLVALLITRFALTLIMASLVAMESIFSLFHPYGAWYIADCAFKAILAILVAVLISVLLQLVQPIDQRRGVIKAIKEHWLRIGLIFLGGMCIGFLLSIKFTNDVQNIIHAVLGVISMLAFAGSQIIGFILKKKHRQKIRAINKLGLAVAVLLLVALASAGVIYLVRAIPSPSLQSEQLS